MQTKITKTLQSKIDRLLELMTQAATNWVEAGKLLVEMVSDNPDALDIIVEQNPNVQIDTLLGLLAIGHGLKPEHVLSKAPGISRALALPEPKMKEVFSKPLEIAVQRNGTWITELKPIEKVTKAEAEAAIDLVRKEVCKPDQQVTYHVARSARDQAREARYVILQSGRIKFLHSPEFSFGELEDIIKQHKGVTVATLERDMKKRQVA